MFHTLLNSLDEDEAFDTTLAELSTMKIAEAPIVGTAEVDTKLTNIPRKSSRRTGKTPGHLPLYELKRLGIQLGSSEHQSLETSMVQHPLPAKPGAQTISNAAPVSDRSPSFDDMRRQAMINTSSRFPGSNTTSKPTGKTTYTPARGYTSSRLAFSNPPGRALLTSGEANVPPPPYTPIRATLLHESNSPYAATRVSDNMFTTVNSSIKYGPGPLYVGSYGPPSLIPRLRSAAVAAPVFPSVIAASEALRINLGLEAPRPPFGNLGQGVFPPPPPPASSGVFGATHPSLYQSRQSDVEFNPYSAGLSPYQAIWPDKMGPVPAMREQLVDSICPQPGQMQPALDTTSCLPPVSVHELFYQ